MLLFHTKQFARSVRDNPRRFAPRPPLPLLGRTHLPLRRYHSTKQQISKETSHSTTSPGRLSPARWRVRAASLLLLPVFLLSVARCLSLLVNVVADYSVVFIGWFGDAFVDANTDFNADTEADNGAASEAADLSSEGLDSEGLQQAMGDAAVAEAAEAAAASSDPAVHHAYNQLLALRAASVVTKVLRAALRAAWPFMVSQLAGCICQYRPQPCLTCGAEVRHSRVDEWSWAYARDPAQSIPLGGCASWS